jgi:hypothetical protein
MALWADTLMPDTAALRQLPARVSKNFVRPVVLFCTTLGNYTMT